MGQSVEDVPTPATMDELVKLLREVMGDGGLTDLDEAGLARVHALMANYKVRSARPPRLPNRTAAWLTVRARGAALSPMPCPRVRAVERGRLEKVRPL